MIFSKADKNNSGKLDLQEFKEVVGDIIDRYPQVDIYLKKNQMKDMASLLKKSQESNIIVEIEYFKELQIMLQHSQSCFVYESKSCFLLHNHALVKQNRALFPKQV